MVEPRTPVAGTTLRPPMRAHDSGHTLHDSPSKAPPEGGSDAGIIPVGDTCAACTSDYDCAGANDYCIAEGIGFGGAFCGPDCSSCGSGGPCCAAGFMCAGGVDSGNGNHISVCVPSNVGCNVFDAGAYGAIGDGGVVAVGDTCKACGVDSQCGANEWCVTNPATQTGTCAPDCRIDHCSQSYTCTQLLSLSGHEEHVCYPASGSCPCAAYGAGCASATCCSGLACDTTKAVCLVDSNQPCTGTDGGICVDGLSCDTSITGTCD